MLGCTTESENSESFELVLASYLQAEESGQQIDRDDWVARHPEFGDELRAFFASRERVPRLWTAWPPMNAPCRFGEYELLEEIAHGGMGIVYKARQARPNRIVALKLVRDGQFAGRADIERFHAEAEAAASLDHPNIVPIYEVGQHAGQHFFTMKFVAGGSLADCRSRPPGGTLTCETTGHQASGPAGPAGPTAPDSARLLSAIARAVHYAHQRGILHRDLKPANILVGWAVPTNSSNMVGTAHPTPYITDFGLAKRFSTDETNSLTSAIVGTASYMAPEQATDGKSITTAADIYSLGAILYELLTGRPPFKTASALETLQQVRDCEVTPPRSLDPTIDLDLETICLKCLEKEPTRRYASAEALADDLDRWLSNEPILARPASPLERALRRCQKHPLTASLAVAIVLIAFLGLIGILTQWQAALANEQLAQANEQKAEANAATAQDKAHEANQQRDEAQKQRDEVKSVNEKLNRALYTAHMNMASHAWQAGAAERVLDLLDQHRPRAEEKDLRGFEWYYLHRLCFSDQLTIRGSATAIAFSPDGQKIVGAGYSGVNIWDIATGKILVSFEGHDQRARCLAYSPDGKLVASGSHGFDQGRPTGGSLKIWEAETGKEILSINDAAPVMSVAFSPDGATLASGSFAAIKLWNARSGKLQQTVAGFAHDVRGVAFSPAGKRLAGAGGSFEKPELKVWDLETGNQTLELKGHEKSIASVVFSPDGQRLLSASLDRTARIWDSQSGHELVKFKGHSAQLENAQFTPDGNRIATTAWDRTVRIWDAKSGEELTVIRGNRGVQTVLAISPDGKRLAAASSGYITLFDANNSQESAVVKDPAAVPTIRTIVSANQRRFASISNDSVRLYESSTKMQIATLKHPEANYTIRRAVFSPDSQLIVTWGSRGDDDQGRPVGADAIVWNADTGTMLHTLTGHTANIEDVEFTRNGRQVATASWDKTVTIWETESGKKLFTYHSDHPVRDVAFTSDARNMVSSIGGYGYDVTIWATDTGDQRLKIRTGVSFAVALSPDDTRLAVASANGGIRLFDARSGDPLFDLRGHTAPCPQLAFSPDGKRLASASADQSVKIWDLETGDELLTLSGHTNIVHNITFSTDGHRLIASSSDGTARIWDATPVPEERSQVFEPTTASAGPRPHFPRGWWWWWGDENRPDYEVSIHRAVYHTGAASASIQSTVPAPRDVRNLIQTIRADEYRNKRIRVSTFLKTKNVEGKANLWMRIDAARKSVGFAATDEAPLQGTTDWQKQEVVLDVPAEAVNIVFAFALRGAGQVWADDFQIEVVSGDVPLTRPREDGELHEHRTVAVRDLKPINLGFESD
ncbi:MAG TPA: protein kinase [Pirellulaceae bacterium]|jgi:WD40 repeat protein/serine/threonine protein kinase